jgi:hypothetical protein
LAFLYVKSSFSTPSLLRNSLGCVTTLPGAGRVQGVGCAEVKAGTAIRPRAAAEYIWTTNNGRDTPEIGMSVAVNHPPSGGGSSESHHLTKSSRKIWAFDEQKMNADIGIASIALQ